VEAIAPHPAQGAKMKIEMHVGLVSGRTRREVTEIDDANFEGLSDEEREEWINEYTYQWMNELLHWGWEEVE
jgi:hypothetical protein